MLVAHSWRNFLVAKVHYMRALALRMAHNGETITTKCVFKKIKNHFV